MKLSRDPTASLENELATATGAALDAARARLAWHVRRSDPDRASNLAQAVRERANLPDGVRAYVLATLATVSLHRGELGTAVERAEEACDAVGPAASVLRCQILVDLAAALVGVGRRSDVLLHISEADSIVQALDLTEERARIVAVRGRLAAAEGDGDRAETHFREALEHATEDASLRADVLVALGDIENKRGRVSAALQVLGEALGTAVAAGAVQQMARARMYIGLSYRRLGDLTLARLHLESALQAARRARTPLGIAAILTNLAAVAYDAERNDDALALGHEALEIFERTGNALGANTALSNLGDTYMRAGDVDSAERFHRQAIERLGPSAPRLRRAGGVAALARIAATRGDLSAAERGHREALSILESCSFTTKLPAMLHDLASVQIDAGRPESALQTLSRARDEAEKMESSAYTARILREYARAHDAVGDDDAARQARGRAAQIETDLQALRAREEERRVPVVIEVQLRDHGRPAPPGSEARVRASDSVRRVLSRAAADLGQSVHAVLPSGEVVSLPPIVFPSGIGDARSSPDAVGSRAERLARMVAALRQIGALDDGAGAPPTD